MRSSTYCTAQEYNISGLVTKLNELGMEPRYFDDVIHVQKSAHNGINQEYINIFYFPFGCISIWGASEADEKAILEELQPFENYSYENPVYEIFYYEYHENAEKTYINEEKNEFVLHKNDTFIKLSMSHALVQSVKLEILEQSVSKLLKNTSYLQQELADKGSVSLSRKKLAQLIGVLFNERYSINLHSDILDTPEFFWRRPNYEPVYLMTAEFMDIQVRQNILNHRLDIIHELYSILSNELNYIHSARLEWIIIILIGIEVVMSLQHYELFTRLFYWITGSS
jgi:uncharacterized Rmd1/YagE family protein